MVISQVKRQSRQKGECPGGLEQTAFQDVFLPHPRECAGKRKTGRFSKTLEIISLKCPSAVRTRDLRPAQSAALEAGVHANSRATSPLLEADALARAAALKPPRVRKNTAAALEAAARHFPLPKKIPRIKKDAGQESPPGVRKS